MELKDFFRKNPRAALGFSGGTDSSYLLYVGLQYGAVIKPYYIKTAFQPQFELTDALRLTEQLGVELTVLEYNVLLNSQVAENPPDRCYYCKNTLFRLLRRQAEKDGFSLLIDGTNASDQEGDRPGMRALKEMEIRSPLRECGLTKKEIRRLSKEAGLFTWDKPAYACLATRIPAGQPIDADMLSRIEASENALHRMGFSDFRVRVLHGAARIQVTEGQFLRAAQEKEKIREGLSPFFDTILLDLNTR